MTIHIHNYEAYLLDYFEGTLDPLQTAELLAFLSNHPEIDITISEDDGNPDPNITYPVKDKTTLKRNFSDIQSITEKFFEEFCIAENEGLLSEKDRDRLHTYLIQHPEKQSDYDSYRRTRLKSIVISYPFKKELRKSYPLIKSHYEISYLVSIAAALLFLIVLVLNKPPKNEPQKNITVNIIKPKDKNILEITRPVAPYRITEYKVKRVIRTTIYKSLSTEKENKSLISQNIIINKDINVPMIHPIRIRELHQPDNYQLQAIGFSYNSGSVAINAAPHDNNDENEELYTDNEFKDFIKKLNLWKAAESAVKGINYLTESHLQLEKITDANGHTKSLILDTDNYSISGNIQK